MFKNYLLRLRVSYLLIFELIVLFLNKVCQDKIYISTSFNRLIGILVVNWWAILKYKFENEKILW